MKVRLLIATNDNDYAEHLSKVLLEAHEESFEVSICSSAERLRDMLVTHRFDAGLFEPSLLNGADVQQVLLPFVLWNGQDALPDNLGAVTPIRKYQRISATVSAVLEGLSALSIHRSGIDSAGARISAFWSPAGGVGKTAVSLAYAARMVAEGKQVLYLNLEPFASTSAYFADIGRSVSTVFEKLDTSPDTNLDMYLRSIRQQDNGSGIFYFLQPDNYDDINILHSENITALLAACAGIADELVVDMSSVCDARTQLIFEKADAVYLVEDASRTSQVKMQQFMNQHSVFESIRTKCVFVGNKGASGAGHQDQRLIKLPYVGVNDAVEVYKNLAGSSFAV